MKEVDVGHRFWLKVQIPHGGFGCWEWSGAPDPEGYGFFKVRGKMYRAHRYMWLTVHGTLPQESVLHHCDNPACVNPSHLYLGTQADNIRDRSVRNRACRGERQHSAKLTEADVKHIRWMASFGYPGQAIADMFGMKEAQILAIIRRSAWKHVS